MPTLAVFQLYCGIMDIEVDHFGVFN